MRKPKRFTYGDFYLSVVGCLKGYGVELDEHEDIRLRLAGLERTRGRWNGERSADVLFLIQDILRAVWANRPKAGAR